MEVIASFFLRTRLAFLRALIAAVVVLIADNAATMARQSVYKVLVLYSTDVEPEHLHFANDALAFFNALAKENNFTLDATTDWAKLNEKDLKNYRLVVWLNNFPQTPDQRAAFQNYMRHGGGWLGFHVAGYNDETTKWPWFVDFMGGAVFYTNNWPPLPAKLLVDDRSHAVTKLLPASFVAPANEWYLWKPSPRLNKNVHVLVTLDPSNYPIGVKDIITGGDLPVVWTNTKYRMIYMNMGHGDKIFADATQNLLIAQAFLWLGNSK